MVLKFPLRLEGAFKTCQSKARTAAGAVACDNRQDSQGADSCTIFSLRGRLWIQEHGAPSNVRWTPSALLEQTPLAHAELNVLARVSSDRDLGRDTLWSTQQPCSMCTAAIQFCGVGNTRYLAADPAFLGTDDVRAGKIVDPTLGDPTLGPWAVLATLML